MNTVRTVAELRSALAGPRRAGRRIGLVPTMGAFHEGHLSLMRRARADCDVVVVSLFVNPAQFNDAGDLDRYPRDEAADANLAAAENVNILFAPSPEEVYPQGFSTTVHVAGLSDRLEGEHRGAAHFDGVATVVTKLLNMAGPDVAYFGQKDAQQAVVIRRLVADLNLPTRIEVLPTVREPDGLAMSSRNVLLGTADRTRALALSRALSAVQQTVAQGTRAPQQALEAGRRELHEAELEPEYLELVDADTLTPAAEIDGRPLLAVVAAQVGSVRLIDTQPVSTAPSGGGNH